MSNSSDASPRSRSKAASRSARQEKHIWLWTCVAGQSPAVIAAPRDVPNKPAPPTPSICRSPIWKHRDNGVWTCAAGPARTVSLPDHAILRASATPAARVCPTPSGKRGQDKAKGQFYTTPELAARFYRVFQIYFDPAGFLMLEPSAGCGAFSKLLPAGSFGCDIEPMVAGIYEVDFLKLTIHSNQRIVCIGNPPFGINANLAKAFFNRAASFSDVIAFILPKTFRKTGTINSLDDRFHLLHEEEVPDDAFIFQGKVRSVPTVFQIWIRRDYRRARLPDIKTHAEFEFAPAKDADFALQRVGKDAGKVHHGMKRSPKAHYFIKGNVEDAMKELQSAFGKVAANTAGTARTR